MSNENESISVFKLPPGWTVTLMADQRSAVWAVKPATGGLWHVEPVEKDAVDWAWKSFGMTQADYERLEADSVAMDLLRNAKDTCKGFTWPKLQWDGEEEIWYFFGEDRLIDGHSMMTSTGDDPAETIISALGDDSSNDDDTGDTESVDDRESRAFMDAEDEYFADPLDGVTIHDS